MKLLAELRLQVGVDRDGECEVPSFFFMQETLRGQPRDNLLDRQRLVERPLAAFFPYALSNLLKGLWRIVAEVDDESGRPVEPFMMSKWLGS